MTTEVKRFSGRTYGKSQESSASKAFDEVFSKPKATNMKWGNASFVKSRIEEENEPKKSVIEEPSDPFSFEFDGDRSPKKRKIQPSVRPVVQPAVRYLVPSTTSTTQPAVRIKTDLHDEDENDLVVKRAPVKTYTKKSRKVKLENDKSQTKMDTFVKPSKNSEEDITDVSQETPQSSEEMAEEMDDDLYIENDDGSSVDVKDTSFLETEEDNIFVKKEKPKDTDEITVRFRSKYLDPDVYSKFTENVSPKDPVGRLSNSKVVHSNVLKHDAGTTLIVVCSPKVETDIKHTNVETKYFNKTERKTRSQTRDQSPRKKQIEKETAAESQSGSQPEKSQEERLAVESLAAGESNDLQGSKQSEKTVTLVASGSEPSSQTSELTVSSVPTTQNGPDSQSSSGSDLPKIVIRNKRTIVAATNNNVVTTDKATVNKTTSLTVSNGSAASLPTSKSSANSLATSKVSANTTASSKSSTNTVTASRSGAFTMTLSKESVTSAPARKFHRIFRSRNKGLVESPQEVTNSQPEPSKVETTPDNSQRSEEVIEASVSDSQDITMSEQSQESSQEEVQVISSQSENQERMEAGEFIHPLNGQGFITLLGDNSLTNDTDG